MEFAYTVGNSSSYDKALAGPEPVYKVGKTEEYGGGWVWKTPEEAKEFLKTDYWHTIDWGDGKPRDPLKFSVYKLQLKNTWETDTYKSPDYENASQLLVDALILGKQE